MSKPAVAGFVVFGFLIAYQIGYSMFFKPGLQHPYDGSPWVVPKSLCSGLPNDICKR